MRLRAAVLLVAAVGIAAASCSEHEQIRSETEHLSIEYIDREPLCPGSLGDLEAQLAHVAGFLGVGIPHRIHVLYGESVGEEYCNGAAGCTWGTGASTRVASSGLALNHELVHAVRWSNGVHGTRFVEEGLAEFLGVTPPQSLVVNVDAPTISPGPAVLFDAPWNSIGFEDYGTAAHFLAWLIEDVGASPVVAFLNDARYTNADDPSGAFAAVLGRTVTQAEMAWREEAPAEYRWGTKCVPDRIVPWEADGLSIMGVLDCDDAKTRGTVGTGPLSYPITCFELSEPMSLHLGMVGDNVTAQLFTVECAAETGLSAEHYQRHSVDGGESMTFLFAPCLWAIAIVEDGGETVPFELRIEPGEG